MPAKRTNAIIKVEGGVAHIDVSTPKHPKAVLRVDESDLPVVFDGKGGWTACCTSKDKTLLYATRVIGGRLATRQQLFHRVLLGLSGRHALADHTNGDGLDNRRCNVRRATKGQNNTHGRHTTRSSSTSGYRGVTADTRPKRVTAWIAQIQSDGKRHYLGAFVSAEDAARAYDKAARKLHGRFARLNFPGDGGGA